MPSWPRHCRSTAVTCFLRMYVVTISYTRPSIRFPGDMFAKSFPKYSHATLNPPYKKISGNSAHQLALRRVGIETVNRYSAFVALAVAQAAPGGQIVAIIPHSFCSELIRAVIEDFAPRFAPDSLLVYAGDTGDKWGYFDAPLLAELGVDVELHGKMPDVVLHYTEKNWLLLSSRSPAMGRLMAKDMKSLLSSLPSRLRGWFMSLPSRIGPL